jgi:protein-arginine kinase
MFMDADHPHNNPPLDPLTVATRRACLKILADEPLEAYDRDAIRAYVFAEDMEALPDGF